MIMLEVKLLTSLKESSGATLASGAKVYPKGAAFSGTLDTLPKAIVDAIKGKEWYVKVTEILVDEPVEKVDFIPEVVSDTVLASESLGTDETEEEEGQSTGNEENDDAAQSEDNLKDKIKKAGSKLKAKD